MILTLAWKELREHYGIWLIMVGATAFLGPGLGHIVSAGNPAGSQAIAHLAILGLAATYGVVCGAMMLAGEEENGTITFLDIFLGRRGLLWTGKFFIGLALVLAQVVAVGLTLFFLKQAPPTWGPALFGAGKAGIVGQPFHGSPAAPQMWFLLILVVTLESYAWGLFGSAFSRRVLSAAAIGAAAATPVWLISILTPSPVFLGVRVIAVAIVLVVSQIRFQANLGDNPLLGPPPTPEPRRDRRRRFLDRWERYDRREEWDTREDEDIESIPFAQPVVVEASATQPADVVLGEKPPPLPRMYRRPRMRRAGSIGVSLWWLTALQGWVVFTILAGLALFVGCFVPTFGQVLWPLATLAIGIACGLTTFGPEQRDLSYQFLSTQHLPLKRIWTFKIVFWLSCAVLLSLLLLLSGYLVLLAEDAARAGQRGGRGPMRSFHFGTLRELMGPVLFFSVWLIYGFCAGQVFVWLCRKLLMALALGALAALAAVSLWLPALLCGGTSGWQLWLPPLLTLAATYLLVRAWAGGRIKERRPMTVVLGLGVAILAWAGVNAAHRAWELPDAGSPLDRGAFRASIPSGKSNEGGQKLQEALSELDDPGGKQEVWLARLAEAQRLPLGVIESPQAEGFEPPLRYLPACLRMTDALLELAGRQQNAAAAFEHLSQAFLLSRTVRNKAPLTAYLTGMRIEGATVEASKRWLARGTASADVLRAALDELSRHAGETPPPVDCVRAECYRAQGNLVNPNSWSFASTAAGARRVPETWLVGGIAFSLDLPWEDERKTRLWQLGWAGLFRSVETPAWELPALGEPEGKTDVTRHILAGWLPSPESKLTRARLAAWLDASWLADERLFCDVTPLRSATAARCRFEAARLSVALVLYQRKEGKAAQKLEDLVPNFLHELPVDPYSGRSFGYRLAKGERIAALGETQPGQGVLWSTGADRVDNGGLRDGSLVADENATWRHEAMDVITLVPMFRR